MQRMIKAACALGLVLFVCACADTNFSSEDGSTPACKKEGETRCEDNTWQTCKGGQWSSEDCKKAGKVCIKDKGCLTCEPNETYCQGQEVRLCDAKGASSSLVKTCRPDQQCALGKCFDFCELTPSKDRSNVGCEFWAVDLPNEYYCMSIDGGKTCLTYGCAACQQFAVAVANQSNFKVLITIEINEAAPGQPLKLKQVEQKYIGANTIETFKLPMREVDCTTWTTDVQKRMRRKDASQTCLSSRAYRLKSSYPVVAYQFNPLNNDFSNGASLLIPKNGLDSSYYALSWSTANPISIPIPGQYIEGLPDFMNVTIIGTEDATDVEVTVTHKTQASKDGKIKAAKKGETIKAQLGKFDVLNINTIQDFASPTGDLTGTKIKASKPVAVFSGGARTLVPDSIKDYSPTPPEPSDSEYKVCCTEHFEQQMFPISSLGKNFAATRTPIRSTSSIVEPDFYRILATEDGTTVKTNLSNFPSFTLKAGEYAKFWSTVGYTIEADKPVMVGQYAVSQGFLDSWKVGGDPEFVVFPPVEQYRKDYIFLTPTTFTKDYVVIGVPAGTTVKLDGVEVTKEFDTTCTKFAIGQLQGKQYNSLHCPVADGIHTVNASGPVGIMVYGYYGVGSYGYPGGADVKKINIE